MTLDPGGGEDEGVKGGHPRLWKAGLLGPVPGQAALPAGGAGM